MHLPLSHRRTKAKRVTPWGYVGIMNNSPDETSGEDFSEEAAVEDLSRIGDDDLESSIEAIHAQIGALHARLSLRIAEYDRRGLAGERHVLTTSQWLSHRLRIAKQYASSLIRTGRTLDQMPTTKALASRGAITAAGVRKLTAARTRHPEAFDHHEPVLADAAAKLAQKDLRRAIQHWEQQVAYPDAIAEVASKRRRRRLSVNQTWDGMYAITGELDPETGHVVSTALAARVDPANLDPSDDRTHAQKMADALGDVCAHGLTAADHPTSGGTKPTITVTVDFDSIRDAISSADSDRDATAPSLPEIDGFPVQPETIRKMACDAAIIPVVLGSDSQPLDIGRASRTIPPAIRRAVELRDGGCAWPGCDAPLDWCDIHHIDHWADGGSTSLRNLTTVCRRHHTAIHEQRGAADDLPP